jgi:hypothetical protein
MTGTIELLLGRAPRHKKSLPWYSLRECRSIYNMWMDTYPDAIINIWPRPTNEKEEINYNEPEKELSTRFSMPDFIGEGIFKRETYFHKMYYKEEEITP